jgi:phosphate transport system substrate-binding protein
MLSRKMIAIAALALAGCGVEAKQEPGFAVVGSSTVYPFAAKVAELYSQANPALPKPVITSDGTEAGIAEFCTGNGPETPSILNASARLTSEQFDACKAKGVADIVEMQVGLDGIVFASSAKDGISFPLTPAIAYRALAASPFGEEQKAANWSDLDASLPAQPIIVYGPPASSGTRATLGSLVLEKGCETNPRYAAMKETDRAGFKQACDTLRTDAVYLEQGEKDDLVVRKVAQNPRAIGIFGYSYLEQSGGTIKPLPLSGVEPTAETIPDGSYPAARPLFLYVKKSHLEAKPGLKDYLALWRSNWGKGGELEKIGLVPLAAGGAPPANMPVMTGEGLE